MGIILLAKETGVKIAERPHEQLIGAPPDYHQKTLIAQLADAVFHDFPMGLYLIAGVTALILVLAANTAFNGFPVLGSILAQDRYLPRQLHTRGDRLAFSNGILFLAFAAIAFIVAFQAQVTALIQLYIVGVFVSFTLSQIGMVRHWTRLLTVENDPAVRAKMKRSRVINTIGLICTGTVLVIVVVTKFVAGAWIAILAMGGLFMLMKSIRKHYDTVARELEEQQAAEEGGIVLPSRNHAIVLVSKLHLPTMRALAYARATRPDELEAITVSVDDGETRAAGAQVGGQRYLGAAQGDRLALPRDHPSGAGLRQADQQGVAAHRRHGLHPRVRGRPLVGAGAAQPERAAAEGPTAVHAERDGDFRSLAAQFVGAAEEAAAACGAGRRPSRLPGLIDELTLTTGPPANGGSCVARHEGRVVFVRYALPGEQVRVRVVADHGSYWHADVVEVLEASPDRIDPLCPIAGVDGAGCCDLAFVGSGGGPAAQGCRGGQPAGEAGRVSLVRRGGCVRRTGRQR